jgi:hypothetical protein
MEAIRPIPAAMKNARIVSIMGDRGGMHCHVPAIGFRIVEYATFHNCEVVGSKE